MRGFQFYDVALTPSEIAQEMGLGVAAGGGAWWGALDLIAAGAAVAAAIVAWRWPEARPLPRVLGVRRTWCGEPWLACTPGATCFAARCIRSGTQPGGARSHASGGARHIEISDLRVSLDFPGQAGRTTTMRYLTQKLTPIRG